MKLRVYPLATTLARDMNSGTIKSALLPAAPTRENLPWAFKRARSDTGAAGVDGLDIGQTGRHCVTARPVVREQLLRERLWPSPLRRVTISKQTPIIPASR